MRTTTVILAGALALIGIAPGASALSVDPNPVQFSGAASGSVDFDITDSTLEMTVSVTSGRVRRARVQALSPDGDPRQILDYGVGHDDPDGVNVRYIRVLHDGSVEFFFKSSFWTRYIGAGQKSDPFFVTYDTLQAGDTVVFTAFERSIFGSYSVGQTSIVPEPSSSGLLGLALAGLAGAARARRLRD